MSLANKKPRTSYAQLPQETKDKRNQCRRQLGSNLTEVARAKRNERRRAAYARKANIYPEIRKSNKKARCDKCCAEATQNTQLNNLEVTVEAIPDGIISTDQNGMQTSVVGVIENVSSSFPSALLKLKCIGERMLPSIDHSSMSIGIAKSVRDEHNDSREQLYLKKKGSHGKKRQVVCDFEPRENTCLEKVQTIVEATSTNRINLEVEIDRAAVEMMPTDADYMQPCVVGVLREVTQSSVHCCTTCIHEIGEFQI